MSKIIIPFLIAVFVNSYAYGAADVVDDRDFLNIEDCWNKWSEHNAEFSITHSGLKQEYKLSDAKLNKVYGDVYRFIEQYPRTWHTGKVDIEQLNLLKKAQRAWLQFRDKECELIISNEDVPNLSDPHSEAAWLSCMIMQTNTRTRQLQLYMNANDYYSSPLVRG